MFTYTLIIIYPISSSLRRQRLLLTQVLHGAAQQTTRRVVVQADEISNLKLGEASSTLW